MIHLRVNQLALFFAAIVSGAIGVFYLKQDYKEISEGRVHCGFHAGYDDLLMVGSLIGIGFSWSRNNDFYGVKLIHPTVFLPVTLIICVIVFAAGSSWSTVGTVGIALVGGQTLGVGNGEAVVSGYFEIMSRFICHHQPAPAMAGDLLVILNMVMPGPAVIISFILFCILGFFYSGTVLIKLVSMK